MPAVAGSFEGSGIDAMQVIDNNNNQFDGFPTFPPSPTPQPDVPVEEPDAPVEEPEEDEDENIDSDDEQAEVLDPSDIELHFRRCFANRKGKKRVDLRASTNHDEGVLFIKGARLGNTPLGEQAEGLCEGVNPGLAGRLFFKTDWHVPNGNAFKRFGQGRRDCDYFYFVAVDLYTCEVTLPQKFGEDEHDASSAAVVREQRSFGSVTNVDGEEEEEFATCCTAASMEEEQQLAQLSAEDLELCCVADDAFEEQESEAAPSMQTSDAEGNYFMTSAVILASAALQLAYVNNVF